MIPDPTLLRLWLSVLTVAVLPLACLTVIVLLAPDRSGRRGAVRGSLRAGRNDPGPKQ